MVLYFTFNNKKCKMDSQFSGYQCGKCGATFSRRDELESHKMREHANWLGYQCGRCGEEFGKRGDMEYHKSTRH